MKKKIWLSLIILFLIINGIGILLVEKNPIPLEVDYNTGQSGIVDTLTDYRPIDQVFINYGNKIEGIRVMTATYAQTNCTGTLVAELYNSEDLQLIDQTKFNIADVEDNSYIYLKFNTTANQVKNKKLILRLYAIETGNTKITLWMNNNYNEDMYLRTDGNLVEGSLIFSSVVLNTSTGYKILIQVDEILLTLFIIFYLLIRYNLLPSIKVSFNNIVIRIKAFVIGNIKIISISSVVTVIILGASCLVELTIGNLELSEVESKTIQTISNDRISLEGISILPDGSYINEVENGSFIINNENQYIHNLNLTLGNNQKTDIQIIADEAELKNRSSIYFSSIENSPSEVDTVFKIREAPNIFRIVIKEPNIQISNLAIDNSYYFNWLRMIYIFAICELIYLVIMLNSYAKLSTSNLFLSIALILGFILTITLPVSHCSWDEQIHYKWAVEQSYFMKINRTLVDEAMFDINIPRADNLRENKQINHYLDQQYKKGVVGSTYKKSIFIPYNRLGHLPSGIALRIGRLLHLPFHIQFILGQLANVISYAFIIFLALRKLKTSKVIMSLIALFPTSLFLAANYSYDWWITAFIMLGMAYFLSEAQQPNKKLRAKDMSIMLIALIIGMGPKAIYFPLILLLLLMPKSKFNSQRELTIYRLLIIGSIIIVAGSFLAPFVIKGPGTGDLRGGEDVNAAEQVKFILTHPIQYANILLNFIKSYLVRSIDYTVFLAYLGFSQHYATHNMLILIITLIVTLTDKNEYDKQIATLSYNISIWLLSFITVSLVATALYVSFTPVAYYTINGCQGRYLIPILFPFLSLLGSSKIQNKISEKWYALVMLFIPTYILFNSIWDICIKIYL